MLSPSLGLLDIGGVQCSGIVSPYGVLDLPLLGVTTSHKTSTAVLTTAPSSTSMPIMEYTLLEPICVAIGVETAWITRGDGLHTSCTSTAFQVLKLWDFTSFEDMGSILWDKVKETLLHLAANPPPPTPSLFFFAGV